MVPGGSAVIAQSALAPADILAAKQRPRCHDPVAAEIRCTDTRGSVADWPDRNRTLVVDSSQAARYPASKVGRPGLRTEPRHCRKDRRPDSAADQPDRNRALVVDSPEVAAAAEGIVRRHRRLSPQGQTRSQER